MLDFGREACSDLEFANKREWLVTNGIGGYASGTIAGIRSRSYHGLLIAALQPPVARTLLLAKFDETATYDGLEYSLFVNHWTKGAVEPTPNPNSTPKPEAGLQGIAARRKRGPFALKFSSAM